MDQLAKIELQLASAKTPEELFGVLPADQTRRYKHLLGQLHPDRWEHDPDGRAKAEAMFSIVTQEWKRLTDRRDARFSITTKRGIYRVDGVFAHGDLSNLYRATLGGDAVDHQRLVKIPRTPTNSDLMIREANALSAIVKAKSRRGVFSATLTDSFRHRDLVNGVERRANVVQRLDGFYSLAQVHEAYPYGLDIRDIVWMWRRALLALSLVHELGYIHGAVLPGHVMIHPAKHGLVLVDFCYSAKLGEKVPAVVPRYRDLYAPEVLAKQPVTSGTDIYMLTRTMTRLFDVNVPQQFQAFAKGCTHEGIKGRPDDARRILIALTDLVERLFGKRTFREFRMPLEENR